MSEKIVLVDGHSILNRAFYGIPDLTNAEGLHTNAVYGFLNILLRILDEEKPEYLAVAFDVHAPTFRHKMYSEYKGTRKAMPEELRQQVPLIQEMLQAMNVPLMMLEGYEADDLIGTVSLQMERKGLAVTIISGDRDLLQLCSDTTLLRIPKTKRGGTEIEDYYAKDVQERYELPPSGIIELKALMGDASDNIPGIPGVGEKTATKILTVYGTIENAYAHLEEIKPNKARESLREHYDLAQLSKTLATINRNSPFTLDLEKARIHGLYTPEALALCRRLEFKNLLARFSQQAQADESPKKDTSFAVLESLQDAEHYFRELSGKDVFGVYVVTGSGRMLGLAGADAEGRAAFAPVRFEGGDTLPGCLRGWLLPERADEGAAQGDAAAVTPSRQICTFHLKEQLPFLQGIPERDFFDAAVASYLINPLKNQYAYDDIARETGGPDLRSAEEILGKGGAAGAVDRPEALAEYACSQALAAVSARKSLLTSLDETGMRRLFDEVEMPLVFTLYHMEQEGIRVQGEELAVYGENLRAGIEELEQRIYEQAGETFNIQSPKQLGVILFEKMHLPYAKKTKTGYSTAADVLEKLAEEAPIVQDILSYRQLAKLKSTYADGLHAFIAADGRIHGTFNQMVTATGRISSTDPNLQNIPVRTKLGRELRKVFIPRDGYVFVDADYSQIELRVLAAVSGDEHLIGAYREAKDIHAITASQVFHIPLEEITAEDRRRAKAVNFGIVYGISSFGLSNGLSIPRKEAQAYIEKYFETYPGIKRFLDASVAMAKEKGYAVTLFGRRRPVPELRSSQFMQRSFGERVAMNSPIQGTAADIIKIAMVRVDSRLREEGLSSRLILQVHDELLVETLPSELERVQAILSEEMRGAADLRVPLEIEMNVGKNWYEAH